MHRFLITGSTGFLGSVIINELQKLNIEINTLGRNTKNDIRVDLSKGAEMLINRNYDVIVHAAGKAHIVPRNRAEEKEFFDVNFEGTKNLCFVIEKLSEMPKSFVFISSVAVYGQEQGSLINESYPLAGTTPYAKSKILAEEWLTEWSAIHNITLAILRLPLIAGPNPPGNLGAMVDGIRSGKYVGVGKSTAKKSMVWAEDVARIIPKAAEVGGVYNLTDGYHPSFKEMEDSISITLNKKAPLHIPVPVAKAIAYAGDFLGSRAPINSSKLQKMMSTLTFDDSKAVNHLGWKPYPVLGKIPLIV